MSYIVWCVRVGVMFLLLCFCVLFPPAPPNTFANSSANITP